MSRLLSTAIPRGLSNRARFPCLCRAVQQDSDAGSDDHREMFILRARDGLLELILNRTDVGSGRNGGYQNHMLRKNVM
jgi:hypothetical protein